jgi:hypothetical protein
MNRWVMLADLSEEADNYLQSSARIRQISTSELLQRLLITICDDQLVLGILDDDSKAAKNTKAKDKVNSK